MSLYKDHGDPDMLVCSRHSTENHTGVQNMYEKIICAPELFKQQVVARVNPLSYANWNISSLQ